MGNPTIDFLHTSYFLYCVIYVSKTKYNCQQKLAQVVKLTISFLRGRQVRSDFLFSGLKNKK